MRTVLQGVLTVMVLLASGSLAHAAISCTVSVSGGVAFGVYNPLSALPTDSTGTVDATCTSTNFGTTNVNITSSYSTGSSGTYSMRTLRSGGNVLGYNLYFDAAHTQIRGDGTGGSGMGGATMRLRRNQTQSTSSPIHGRIPAGQDVAPGAYSDLIVVTITY
jgi:spore coat protein U-like protein